MKTRRVHTPGAIAVLGLALAISATASLAQSSNGDGDYQIGPQYKLDPDLTDRGNPKGKSFEFSMLLADSKIFRGDDPTLQPEKKPVRKERRIYVYVPAAYKDGAPAPVLTIHDGPVLPPLDLVRYALDNLTISKDPNRRLPAFIAVAVENGGNDGKKSERGLEYDTLSDRLARFINDEVLAAVLTNLAIKTAYPHIAFTNDPWGRAAMGCSSGGAAALTMGWFRPDLFRRVAAYSGTFVAQQDEDGPEARKYPFGAWEYHSGTKLIENSERKPLRIFTHVSENDLRPNDPEETHHNWVMAGRRTAEALKAKGYHNRFVFSLATGHCDRVVMARLSAGLMPHEGGAANTVANRRRMGQSAADLGISQRIIAMSKGATLPRVKLLIATVLPMSPMRHSRRFLRVRATPHASGRRGRLCARGRD